MRRIEASLVAGAMMIIASGAQAQSARSHALDIQLPDGAVAHIQYSGDVPPEVFFDARPVRPASPWLFPAFGPNSPFAALDRLAEEMDRQAAHLLDEAAAISQHLRSHPEGLIEANSGGFPAGAYSYSIVSTTSAGRVCGRGIEITSRGDGAKPRVVTRSFGNCAGGHAPVHGKTAVPPKPARQPETIEASNRASRVAEAPRLTLTQEAALRY